MFTTPKTNRNFVRLLVALPLMFLVVSGPGRSGQRRSRRDLCIDSRQRDAAHGDRPFLNNDKEFNATIRFNDRTGDNFCTYLKVRAYVQTGASTVHTIGSVCGGRTGTLYRPDHRERAATG